MRKLTYVAGPYTAPTRDEVAANVARAVEYGKQVLAAGFVPVVPHKITEFWDLDGRFAGYTHGDWLEKYCFPLLKQCHAIFLYPGWAKSKGACREFDFALEHGIPVVHSVEELKRLFG